ncbi:MAG: sensor histidine kinase, partial [Anaerolineales bacterium]
VILDSIACVLVGSYANLIHRAELERLANQDLLVEVQEAYRKLQDYAVQVEEQAILAERSRMARELHDSVTQTIFSMNLTVQSARMLWAKDRARAVEQLDRLQELARSAISEVQMLVSKLSPQELADGSLIEVVELAAAEAVPSQGERQQRDGMQIELEVSGDRELPKTTIIALYRIVQEALNNIIKHADTSQAAVRISLESQPAYLEIEDRGTGFEPENAARDLNHIGLAGMSDRAREIGWRLEIISQLESGTCIRVEEAVEWQARSAPAVG